MQSMAVAQPIKFLNAYDSASGRPSDFGIFMFMQMYS